MMLNSPRFIDDSGFFPEQNIETEFFELNESLKLLRPKLGEENYAAMIALSDKMRAHFEADPEDKTDDTLMGRDCILAMEDIIKSVRRRRRRAAAPE